MALTTYHVHGKRLKVNRQICLICVWKLFSCNKLSLAYLVKALLIGYCGIRMFQLGNNYNTENIQLLTKSIVLALAFDSSLHHVSHHSHSCGRDFIATWWIILLGKSWSRLDKLLGSWLSPWYWPLSRSPAAIWRNLFKSITYNALK